MPPEVEDEAPARRRGARASDAAMRVQPTRSAASQARERSTLIRPGSRGPMPSSMVTASSSSGRGGGPARLLPSME